MDIKDRIDLYRNMYNHEIDRRNVLTSELAIHVTMIGVLIAGFSFLFGQIGNVKSPILMLLAVLSFLALTFAIVMSVIKLIQSNFNYNYSFISTSFDLEKWYKNLENHFNGKENKDRLIDEKFNKGLLNYYNDCGKVNTGINDKRFNLLHEVRKWFIIGLIAASISITSCNIEKLYSITVTCYKTILKEDIKDRSEIEKGSASAFTESSSAVSTDKTYKIRRK